MSLFQRAFYTPAPADQTFTNLFRLLDDFDAYSREVNSNNNATTANGNQKAVTGGGHHHHHGGDLSSVRLFKPRFDVRETENAYELHGEVAGVDKKDIAIEFTDPQTLVVSGRVERNYSSGSDEAAEANGAPAQATVTDEATEAARERGEAVKDKKGAGAGSGNGSSSSNQVAARDSGAVGQPAAPAERFWYQERSVGQFSRTFNFPAPVDEANVRAGLDNGILSITVPKAVKRSTRRIAVQ
ncbi:30 kDa heat shock protein [Niveomyces insectorum RCEF 264]|uniref:30 kDa heat shock protein n=1 Tax=Niveomyces insectorum RCEF 264 TaxID=1081102 RepID=A0A167M0J4_9HYPO|nr:30 kDa heat shock protein [Niveomyces insectorum RCEF 264]